MEIERLPVPGVRLVAALYSMPLSTASILRSIAEGAEVQVALMRRLESLVETATILVGTLEEPARALEPGMVRLAGVLDTDVVEQLVTTLPTLVQKLQETLDALEGPVPALAQIVNQQTVGRVGTLLDRIDATVPALNTLPGAEVELRLLRETMDRLIGLMTDAQRTFGSLPGASLLLGRRGGGEERTDKALAATAAAAPSLAGPPVVAAAGEEPLPTQDEPVSDADEPTPAQVRTAGKRKGRAGQGKPKVGTSAKSGHRAGSDDARAGASDASQDGQPGGRATGNEPGGRVDGKRQASLSGSRVAGTGGLDGSAESAGSARVGPLGRLRPVAAAGRIAPTATAHHRAPTGRCRLPPELPPPHCRGQDRRHALLPGAQRAAAGELRRPRGS